MTIKQKKHMHWSQAFIEYWALKNINSYKNPVKENKEKTI